MSPVMTSNHSQPTTRTPRPTLPPRPSLRRPPRPSAWSCSRSWRCAGGRTWGGPSGCRQRAGTSAPASGGGRAGWRTRPSEMAGNVKLCSSNALMGDYLPNSIETKVVALALAANSKLCGWFRSVDQDICFKLYRASLKGGP